MNKYQLVEKLAQALAALVHAPTSDFKLGTARFSSGDENDKHTMVIVVYFTEPQPDAKQTIDELARILS